MTHAINDTHDPALRCRVESAHDPGTDFPIQNLPFGVFARGEGDMQARIGVAIGNYVLDLVESRKHGLLEGMPDQWLDGAASASLNALMSLGSECWSALRRQISRLLRADTAEFKDCGTQIAAALVPMAEARMLMPAHIGDYTDFYASIHHALNVGSMFRPESPLLPNYKYVPVGYHGRASSIVISGTPVRRPCGQLKGPAPAPDFGPSRMLDYELEVGAFVGPGNRLGSPIDITAAESHLFGLCLVNDWSARDIQRWEYQPLGPFLAKSFATTISPWIVTMEALAPFRIHASPRPPEDPSPLPYLTSSEDQQSGGFDLELEVLLSTQQMRARGRKPVLLSRGSFADLYWTMAQLLTHHASNGCNLNPGDLLASGTISGATKSARGCLLELTSGGSEPVVLPEGESRRFLEDGDEVIMRGRAERPGFAGIGFGACSGIVQGNTSPSVLRR